MPLMYSCLDSDDQYELTERDVYGAVSLFDEFGNPTDNFSMKVSVDGTIPPVSGVTDHYGTYLLKDVPFGTYDLIFEKSGFGTYVMKAVEHINTGSPTKITRIPLLSEESSTKIRILTIETSVDTIFVTVVTDPPATMVKNRYIRLFYSSQSNVGNLKYEHYSDLITVDKTSFTLKFEKTYFTDMGYDPGQSVFVRAYGDSYYSNEYVNDSLRMIFPNLNENTPGAVSFEVP